MSHLATISEYYNACSIGDAEAIQSTLDENVVHWFLNLNPACKPVRGGEHLARYWRKVHGLIRATWVIDHVLDGRDEAVIEWTMFWNPGGASPRVATRGAEWFTFAEDGRINEIRSYYRQHQDRDTELDSFPYTERGYSVHGVEHSLIHAVPTGETPT